MSTSNAAVVGKVPCLERLPQVKLRTGLSRSEIYRRITCGEFPRPVKLGKHIRAWDSSEIDRWIENVIQRSQLAA